MTKPLFAGGLLLVFSVSALSCSDITFVGDGPGTFQLTVEGSHTAAVGDTLVFRYEATAPSLNGIIVDYGDGIVDSVGTFGAVTATGLLPHAYSDSGTYIVRGRAEDVVLGTLSAEVTVQIVDLTGGV